jgi:hypothetical protein
MYFGLETIYTNNMNKGTNMDMMKVRSFVVKSMIEGKWRELGGKTKAYNAYMISLVENDIIDEVSSWKDGDLKEWLEYHCNICLDEGDELPEDEEW